MYSAQSSEDSSKDQISFAEIKKKKYSLWQWRDVMAQTGFPIHQRLTMPGNFPQMNHPGHKLTKRVSDASETHNARQFPLNESYNPLKIVA